MDFKIKFSYDREPELVLVNQRIYVEDKQEEIEIDVTYLIFNNKTRSLKLFIIIHVSFFYVNKMRN